jgi:hypothetical protein
VRTEQKYFINHFDRDIGFEYKIAIAASFKIVPIVSRILQLAPAWRHKMRTNYHFIAGVFFLLIAGLLCTPQKSNGNSDELTYFTDSVQTAQTEANNTAEVGECSCCGYCRPLWTVNAGTVILHRDTPRPSPIVLSTHTGATLLDASDFSFNWAAGADIEVVRRVVNYEAIDAIDFRYFGVQSLNADTSIDTGGLWRPAYALHGSIPRSLVNTVYSSQFHSAELNAHRDSAYSWLTWLAGFRWIGLDEQTDLSVQLVSNGTISSYTYATRNNLYGGQIGTALKLWDHGGPFRINCLTKAGLYGNTATNKYDGIDSFGNYALLSTDRSSPLAFVGDINLTAAYQLSKHIALQGGYQMLWVQGVAVAGDQTAVIDLTNHTGIAANGGVFYHGAMASVNFTW